MIIGHSETTLKHESQNTVQFAANERIFGGLDIAAKIEAMADEFAEQVLPYAGSMPEAKKQARAWIVQALADSIAAEGDYELMLIS